MSEHRVAHKPSSGFSSFTIICVIKHCNYPFSDTSIYQYVWIYIQVYPHSIPGGWFGTFFISSYIGNSNPKWLIFQRGWNMLKPPTRYLLYHNHTPHLQTEKNVHSVDMHGSGSREASVDKISAWVTAENDGWNHKMLFGELYPLVNVYIAIEHHHF